MNITCVIGARGGSKGLAGKNIRSMLGKPLIAWSIEQALACPEITRVVVSTDSTAIADVARAYGADVPFIRPAELANDTAGKWQVWQHALQACDQHYNEPIDLYVDLDCTNPLRDVSDISNAIAQYRASKLDAVFSVCEARKNPYFNMLEIEHGTLRICKSLPAPIVRRQDAPAVFEHVASVYVLDPEYLRRGTGLLSGRTQGYDIGSAKSLDVDSEFDFELIEYLMRKKLEKKLAETTESELLRFDIRDSVVVLTGCSGVLGSAYCRALAQRGARLVMADLIERNPVELATALSLETGAQILGVACDVGTELDVIALFAQAVEYFGKVDVVINNAAATGELLMKTGAVFASFEEYPLAVWDQVIRTNLTGVFLVAREGGKAMLASGGGSLINVSSIYGVVAPDHRIYEDMPFSSFPAYSAGKAGVHGLTLWLATYWGRKGIRVNTLVPGGVFNGHQDEFVRRYADRTPMGRMANSDDLVGTVIYLASDASRYCTGQQFIVDGGLTAW